jgi:hypothetical protein
MADEKGNVRELRVTTDQQFELVGHSQTGREVLNCIGTFGGAVVELQTRVRMSGGSLSSVKTIPVDGTHTADFMKILNIGIGNPVWLNITGTTGTTDFIVTARALARE